MLTTSQRTVTGICRITFCVGLGLFVAGTANAGTIQSFAVLQKLAVQAVQRSAPGGARVVATAGNLDPRLRLPVCPSAPVADVSDLRLAMPLISVAVSCPSGAHWTVRVPVHIKMYREVMVASYSLARGEPIGPDDIRPEERNVAGLGYGYMASETTLVGRRLSTPVVVGTVITPSMLIPQDLVQPGEDVSLVATVGSVEVRAPAVALSAGQLGDIIRVRSQGCHCVIQAKVQSDGTVAALPGG